MNGKTDRVAIITGASKGLGRAIVHRLVKAGIRVVAAARSLDKLQTLAEEYKEWVFPVACDVTKSTDVKQMVEQAVKHYGKIDILVNNAGLGHFGSVEDLTEEQWDEMMNVNLKGAFLTCKYSIPYLKQTEGQIINISSVAGIEAFAGGAGYCASKFGMMALSDSLTKELKPYYVKVTTLCPGSIKTEFNPNPKDYSLDANEVAESIHQIISAPKGMIIGQVIMRPVVPVNLQK